MRIQSKLFLGLFLTNVLLIAAVYLLMLWSVERDVRDFVDSRIASKLQQRAEQLQDYYANQQSWAALKQSRRWPSSSRPPRHTTLLDANKQPLLGRFKADQPHQFIAITHQDKTVGWLAFPLHQGPLEHIEQRLLQRQQHSLALISILALLLAALVAWLLARHFIKPINSLVNASGQLAAGEWKVRIDSCRRDELGKLAHAFNALAHRLEQMDNSRKRWLADTSHELRTPLAVIRGDIEAMLDGVRQTNTNNLQTAYLATRQLERLIDDLYTLSRDEIGALDYQKQAVDFGQLLQQVIEQCQNQLVTKQQRFEAQLCNGPIPIWGDSDRLRQLLSNLFNNASRHTHEGGSIHIRLEKQNHFAQLTIEDSAPGVTDAELPLLFEHLYRTDSSRSRNNGGAGLGLTLCQRITDAHQGTITAHHSTLGGLAIILQLPLVER